MCLVGSVVVLIMMVISSGIVLFLLKLRSVNILSSTVSKRWISLIALAVPVVAWLVSFALRGKWEFSCGPKNPAEGAGNLHELCSWSIYFLVSLGDWQLPVGFDAEGAAGPAAAEPDVWTDWS